MAISIVVAITLQEEAGDPQTMDQEETVVATIEVEAGKEAAQMKTLNVVVMNRVEVVVVKESQIERAVHTSQKV